MAQADFQDPSADFALKEEVLVEKRKYGDNERNSTASVRRAVIVKKERGFALVEFTEKDSSLRSDKQKIPYARLKKVPPPPPVAVAPAAKPAPVDVAPAPLRAVPQAFSNVNLVPPLRPEQRLVQLPKPEQQRLPTSPLMESATPLPALPASVASTPNSGVYPQGYISMEPSTSAPEAKQSLPPPIETPVTPALTPKQEARSLGVGDDVMVHEILGSNARFSKPRKARIVERLSSGVRVVFFDDKSEKAVQWNRIERAVDELAPTAPSVQPTPPRQPPPPSIQPPPPVAATATTPPVEVPKAVSDLTAWLEMGAQLLDQLVRKQTTLREEAKQHASEAQRLVVLANDKTREAAAMQTQIDQFAPQIHAFSTDMLKKL